MTITIKAKVFGKIQTVRCVVEADGSVLVYDSVAGHYTRCHSMSKSAQAKVRKLARDVHNCTN